MREKAPKPPKVKIIRQRKKINFNSIFFILISLILTAALFIGLITLENRLSGEIIYTNVVVAKTDITKGVTITKDNAKKYFEMKNIVYSDAVDGVLYNIDNLIGYRTSVPLVEGEAALLKDFENLNTRTEHLQDPVQVAVDTGALSSIAGGILREGDLINIVITIDSKDTDGQRYVSSYAMENVYVSAAMDSSGRTIAGDDTKTPSTMLLLIIEKADELVFADALANGRAIRISKVL